MVTGDFIDDNNRSRPVKGAVTQGFSRVKNSECTDWEYLREHILTGDLERVQNYTPEVNYNFVPSRSPSGTTLLIASLAANHHKYEIVKFLLANGADPNLPNSFGMTPLHYAVKDGYPEIIKILLEYGAKTDIRDTHGDTPKSLLDKDWLKHNHQDEIRLLLKRYEVLCRERVQHARAPQDLNEIVKRRGINPLQRRPNNKR